jgi:23S rRNA (uracil1939-C5)-methyltransferase
VSTLWLATTSIAVGGEAVARDADGRVVFIGGALPGERVLVELTEEKGTFARGRTVEVGEASVQRRTPPCPYVAEGCGGCDWQHVDPDAQARLKQELVRDTLRRMAGVADPLVQLGPRLPSERSRTTLRCTVTAGQAGFRHRRSHESLTVDDCLIAHPFVAELVTDGSFGEATEVVLRAGARTGERLAVVSPSAQGVHLPDDVIVVGSDELRSGRRAWYHEEAAGLRWRISATSFFQSRADGADALVAQVIREVAELAPGARRMVDLCCGVGLFAGALADQARSRTAREPLVISAVERHRPAVIDAQHNLAGSGARVIRSTLEQWRPSRTDVVVADPARSGLGRRGVDAVAATGADLCVLVSCDPASLGRDASLLAANGLRHVRSTVIDLFPNTSHVEVVSSFAGTSATTETATR